MKTKIKKIKDCLIELIIYTLDTEEKDYLEFCFENGLKASEHDFNSKKHIYACACVLSKAIEEKRIEIKG